MEGVHSHDEGLGQADRRHNIPFVEAPAEGPAGNGVVDTSSEITAPGGEELPDDLYYDHTGPLPAAADYAEIQTADDVPEQTPLALWHGPWRAEDFVSDPPPPSKERKQKRNWRDPLPPPEPPHIIPALEYFVTPHQRAVERERRIGARLRRIQRRFGLMD